MIILLVKTESFKLRQYNDHTNLLHLPREIQPFLFQVVIEAFLYFIQYLVTIIQNEQLV